MIDEQRIDSLRAKIGEHFGDYLLIVRIGSRGLSWRSSDPTWASGAAGRYITGVMDHDFLQQKEHRGHCEE